MKSTLLAFFFLAGSVFSSQLNAIHPESDKTLVKEAGSSLTVQQFIDFDLRSYRDGDGKRIPFIKRISLSIIQKKLARDVRKGRLEANEGLAEAMKAAPSANKRGLLSLIFSSLGLIFMFIPYIVILGFGLSVAGFVLGIIGLNRDEDMTMALLGVILGGIGLLIYLLAIIVVAAWVGWF